MSTVFPNGGDVSGQLYPPSANIVLFFCWATKSPEMCKKKALKCFHKKKQN